MIFVKDAPNSTDVSSHGSLKVNNDLQSILNEHVELSLDDILDELPPKRGDDDHRIDLIPRSSPPNKPPYQVLQAQQEKIMLQVNELVQKGMQGVWVCNIDVRDDIFHKRYRLPFEVFNQLLQKLLPFWPCEGDGQKVQDPVKPERALSCTLLRLVHNESTFHIADTFGIGELTMRKYCNIIVEILATKLRPHYISIPFGEKLHNIIADFQTLTLLPNVCGAINGSHIKLAKKPNMEHIPAQYWCRHHFHSVLLQAICDVQKRIWDVYVLAPGGTNDAAHWKASSIYRRFKEGQVLQEPSVRIGQVRVLPYLLADSGYGTYRHLITPFREGHPPAIGDGRAFNCHLSKGRVCIEHAFGLLKNC
ncbi:hypothetical protein L7F22_001991 [Adiantum nelumboides]|nr:hypothetical protein [Adiantum nelumboides]